MATTNDSASAQAGPSKLKADKPAASFKDLSISPPLLRALSHLSITVPTPIQSKTIPTILSGSDLIGGSPTGTGKTLCFALPILHSLLRDPVGGHSVVLTPTRELAVQLHEAFLALAQGAKMGIKCSLVLGGMDMMKQATELARGRPHVVVATPGRLWDLLVSGGNQEWGLERCKFLVLDEADRLLTPTFAEALGSIMEHLPPPERRQTLLFSATLTEEIEALAQKRLGEAEAGKGRKIKVERIEMDSTTPEKLRQRYIFVPSHVREVYLYHLLTHPPTDPRAHKRRRRNSLSLSPEESDDEEDEDRGEIVADEQDQDEDETSSSGSASGEDSDEEDDDDASVADSEDSTVDLNFSDDDDAETDYERHYISPSGHRLLRQLPIPTIIFVSRCRTAELLCRLLREMAIPCLSLHSQLSQPLRLENLQKFRGAPNKWVLVATDVASRGLDVPEVGMVVNYDLPAAWEDYLHRVGRTARAGRSGWAVSFVGERDVDVFQGIEARLRVKGKKEGQYKMKELPMPEERVLEKLNRVATAKRVAGMELADGGFGEREQRNKEKGEKRRGKAGEDGETKKRKKRKEAV
ncbi:DEAD-domain-containing protein [Jaminaea rosea]|uniref:DEAD-domain-containing protein n=1 Tax=Jaminaea rosea TaxID=1569628 RepID=A0A316UYV4_9BASI|nr:DEAD-domain-containing protein [Jaminaea rosea]PWN30174.1 DEAD-domain-containing protein [Jaminaea rosea]